MNKIEYNKYVKNLLKKLLISLYRRSIFKILYVYINMIKKLSNKQSKILEWYQSFIDKNGYTPTYAYVAEKLWLTPWAIFFHVKNLNKLWYLHLWDVTKKVQQKMDIYKIPILWYVACWEPIDVKEEVLSYIDIWTSIFSNSWEYYGLIAKWDSMQEADIRDGDYLIIKKQDNIDNNWQIMVVIDQTDDFQDKATLKRVYKNSDALMLSPANPKFPITFLNKCSVRWRLVKIIKNL